MSNMYYITCEDSFDKIIDMTNKGIIIPAHFGQDIKNPFEAAIQDCSVSILEDYQPDRIRIFPRISTLEFRINLENKYPNLFENDGYIAMLEYLIFGSFVDRNSKKLIIPRNILAAIEGKQDDLANNRYSAIEFLKAFKEGFPRFAWDNYSQGIARTVSNRGFDDEDLEWIRLNLINKRDPKTPRVFFRSGEPYTTKKLYVFRNKIDTQLTEDTKTMDLNADQRKIIDYLEALDPKLFSRMFNDNMENTLKLKDALIYDPTKPESKLVQERILDHIVETPKPHYQADCHGRTMRIHAANECFIGLKRELRKSLCKGCYEADLRSSQFAIVAMQYKAKAALDFIATGKSIWDELVCFALDKPTYERADKDVMKTCLYSLAFGKSENGVTVNGKWHEGLIHILQKRGLVKALQHPIMRNLLEQRAKWFRAIVKQGGWKDIYGQWQAYHPETRRANAVAATVIQSIEFAIIHPVFDVAIEHGERLDFKIITFQHDGFTLRLNDNRKLDKIETLLQNVVQSTARQYNVDTILEFTELK